MTERIMRLDGSTDEEVGVAAGTIQAISKPGLWNSTGLVLYPLYERHRKAKVALFRSVAYKTAGSNSDPKGKMQAILRRDGFAARHRYHPARARSFHIFHITFRGHGRGCRSAAALVRQRSQVSTLSQCPGFAGPKVRRIGTYGCSLVGSS
ncbi:uncharacterized protein LY79DRAFT_158168 [Colletotrichum navitas]|uniref:Uncharacterized protein n=1 Tax=Colletotrichum navitas TaxID=681940 RepID=A0AAD8Q3Q5_9PEZI|nr:uncharacterized protein LY79DRAFT_158168 [Colletotrichum navitas]KAK1594477.1 hypothetical protein LY79DRAFT_158168 [Colletotrichum navitas]